MTTPASQRQAVADYLARLARNNPAVVPEVRRAFAGVNLHQRFADAVRPNGLRADDAADVMAAFLLLGHETLTGREAGKAEIRGVRRQVAGQLLTLPQMRNPANRAKFGEELKIQFVVIGSGVRNAPREGKAAEYRRFVARFYRGMTGQDLARFGLSPAGFIRR